MQVQLPFGKNSLTLELPAGTQVPQPAPAQPLAHPQAAVAAALDQPLGRPPLADLARGRRRACVVISDITRPVPNRLLLPPILARLGQAGLPPSAITILIATGMHRPNLGAELEELLGQEIADRYPVINHDCQAREDLLPLGEIGGHLVELNRHFLKADLKILTGLIEPHTFAGYSGGGKSVLPGLASLATMRFMHSHALIQDPRLQSCRLADNPFQDYVRQAARLSGVDLVLNVVLDQKRRLLGMVAGETLAAHDQGCRLAQAHASVSLAAPARAVITTGGGHPLDATFYQSTKGIIAARDLLAPGGEIFLVSACSQGLGGMEFRQLLAQYPSFEAFEAHFSDPANFVVDQWGVQRLYQCRRHAGRILVHAPGLSQKEAALLGVELVEDPQLAAAQLGAKAGSLAVIPQGPYLAGRIAKDLI